MIENQLEVAKKKIFLGYSKKWTLYDSGCLVHCVARALGKPVLEVHEKLKVSGCFYADKTGDICLLDLSKIHQIYPEFTYLEKITTWDQDRALLAITKNGGLIVEVDSNSIMDGTQQHFVYFRGNGEMEDPLGAKVRPTTYYKVISMRIFDLTKIEQPVNQSSNDSTRALEIIAKYKVAAKHGNLEGAANAAVGATFEVQTQKEKIVKLESSIFNSTKAMNELIAKNKTIEESVTTWQSEASTANNKYSDLLNKTQNPSELIKMFINLFRKNDQTTN